MNFDKATPRPWGRSGVRSRTQAGWPFISIGHESDPNCVLVLYGRTNDEQVSAEQDARLIVKAVNLHEELLSVLRGCVDAFEAIGNCSVVYDRAVTVLAKAETP
jgi:hypothetical protein